MAKVGARDDVCKYENGGKSGYSVQIKEQPLIEGVLLEGDNSRLGVLTP